MDIIERIYNENKAFVENDNFKGVKKIIVDNYSDEAHFIYELLQNADDAKATEISFELKEDRLIVSHNGIPFTENDLEGICSISRGTKSDDYTKIGKFGIGFKSVFVYTESPQIYSGNYSFEIKDLVLPRKIQGIKKEKSSTVFIIPFNAKKTKGIAWDRISKKLNNLGEDAILFLNNVKTINTIIDDECWTILKDVIDNYSFYDNSEFEHIRIIKCETGYEYEVDEEDSIYYYLFKRKGITLYDTDEEGELVEVHNQSVMVAYLEVDGDICTLEEDPYNYHEECFFVFFPTRIQSNCNFLVHAPFITKSSRDTIALNNLANDELMKNIGVLIADSIIVLAREGQLSVYLLERLFFCDGDYEFGNNDIFESFKNEYYKLLHGRRALIPCDNGGFKSLSSVLFTTEKEEDYSQLIDLFGYKWLSEFMGVQNASAICSVDGDSGFFDFLVEYFDCKNLLVEDVIHSLGSNYYEEQSSEWFVDFVNLLIQMNYYGYREKYDHLDELPLVRTQKYKHYCIANAPKVYLNNGTIDEQILEDPKVRYLYKDVYKIKDYSTELNDARDAIKRLNSINYDDFDNHVVLIRKVLIAIENIKIDIEEVKNTKIVWVVNQKNGRYKRSNPENALLGRWERTNGVFDLYTLCNGVDIELIDLRYFEHFNVQELRKIGCKTDGLLFCKGRPYDLFKLNGRSGGWEEKYFRPLTGKANNRQFQPLNQMEYLEEIMDAPMCIEKSIIILRLAKEFDNQIKDWVEWSSRKDFNSDAAYKGYDELYSLFGATLSFNAWMYNKKGELVRPVDIASDELSSEYRKVMTSDISDKLGLKKSNSEMIESLNQKLQSDGLYAIPLEQKELFEEFVKNRERIEDEAKSAVLDKAGKHTSFDDDEGEQILQIDEFEEYDYSDNLDENVESENTEKPIRELVNKSKKNKTIIDKRINDGSLNVDQDEFIPATTDFGKIIENAKRQSKVEIDKLKKYEELQNKALSSSKYTFEWFTTLLDMECINSLEKNSNSFLYNSKCRRDVS